MTKLGQVLTRTALAAAILGGTAALTATPASARVVCNRYHCWHVHGYYDPYYDPYYYPSYYGPGVTFGFNFGGGHYHGGHGGGFHGGGFHGGGFHGGGHHH
ncbi:MAG: hypothetical protein WDN01_08025 [Rhizomicrobium sp.]